MIRSAKIVPQRRVTIADLADLSEVEFDRRLKAERDALAAKFDHRPNLYNSLAEQDRIAAVIRDSERDLRIMRWQSRIKALCIAVAVFCIVYFGGQLVRSAF